VIAKAAGAALEREEREEGTIFAPSFDEAGLIGAIVTDMEGGVLMFAYMSPEALRLTLETGEAHFWSRSRQSLWRKGEMSGNRLLVEEIRTDCDQDVVWLAVKLSGEAACHTGRRSCFYRRVRQSQGAAVLEFIEDSAQPRVV
jgi:phosphoribosyl-AMP cyclohydrolase